MEQLCHSVAGLSPASDRRGGVLNGTRTSSGAHGQQIPRAAPPRSPCAPFRLTYFSTRNSSTRVSASNPALPVRFCCRDAQDKRRNGGRDGAGTRRAKSAQSLPQPPLPPSPITVRAALWERRHGGGGGLNYNGAVWLAFRFELDVRLSFTFRTNRALVLPPM